MIAHQTGVMKTATKTAEGLTTHELTNEWCRKGEMKTAGKSKIKKLRNE